MAVVLALELPNLLSGRSFYADWGNHLYLVQQQANWLGDHLLPTYFLHTVERGAFYPHFLFYGGTLYSATARLGTVIGVVAAFKLTFVAALSSAYFGTVWLARLLGVRGLLAHLPAIVAVSGAYYLSTQYYAGDWPEFIALSMIPLIVAAAVSLLLGKGPIGPAIALAVAAVFATGAHNITAEYGLIFLAVIFVMAMVTVRARKINWRRMALVGGTFAFAVGVNAWYLVPAARYAHLTRIGNDTGFTAFDHATVAFDTFRVVFNPGRYSPTLPGLKGAPPFYVQQPVFVFVWLLIVGIFVVPFVSGRARRIFLGLAAVTAIYLTLLFWVGPWDIAPTILRAIQFRFRLNSYIVYSAAGLVIVAVFMLQRRARQQIWMLALALACAAAFVASVWQVWAAPTYEPFSIATHAGTHLPLIDYARCPAPCPSVETDYQFLGTIQPTVTLPKSVIDIDEARSGSVEFDVPGGQLAAVNVAYSPIIGSEGAPIAGADAGGYVVIDTTKSPPGTPVHVRIAFHSTSATTAGIAISVLCSVALLALLGVGIVLRSRRPRRRSPPARSGRVAPNGAQAPSTVQPSVPTTG